jgi:thymidylate synthase (FAD)
MSTNEAQLTEINELRKEWGKTRRACVPELEEILYEPLQVLDHGFVRVVDYMGDDSAIVQAARVSYGRGTKKSNEDRGLIRYLMRHWHTTPFEMCEIKLHVKLPIFVARQWVRHRTANINEYSARYSILDKEFYLPSPSALAAQSNLNMQGRGSVLTGEEAERVLHLLKTDSQQSYQHYMEMLNLDEGSDQPLNPSRQGLARELARMNLPVNYYTQWYWKIDLNNLLHFLRLRADSHAQYEIRVYADIILDIVKRWVPHTYEAFLSYRFNSASLSKEAMDVIKRMLAGEQITQETSNLTKREWDELQKTLQS